MNNYVTEEKLIEIMLAISDDADHDRIQALLQVIKEREADLVEVGRHLHNAWRGNKDLREDDSKLRIELLELRTNIKDLCEENCTITEFNKGLEAELGSSQDENSRIAELEQELEEMTTNRDYFYNALILEKRMSKDKLKKAEFARASLDGQYTIANKQIAHLNIKSQVLNSDIDRRNHTISELYDQIKDLEDQLETLDNPSLPVGPEEDYGPEPAH